MGNNGNCDVCAGSARNQMDMRRQKAAMYDRYNRNQMMQRSQAGCDTCGNPRMGSGCETCGSTRGQNNCEVCGNTRVQNSCEACGDVRVQNNCEACGNARVQNSCEDCGRSTRDELHGMPIAMAYVPWQNFSCTYDTMQGFRAGTIFPELDKPFYGRRGMR